MKYKKFRHLEKKKMKFCCCGWLRVVPRIEPHQKNNRKKRSFSEGIEGGRAR